ncbi:unnamed protein product [Ceutorhynchus assimilis]|uniref:CCHC-type domain-containing protein n=1 Tax=Ceutorhynchus assimilis TaxID=467358 RepID=A0A9N9QMN3_9CUCU|nr:unnamed protein product [Ceutorhynchus assimilis]
MVCREEILTWFKDLDSYKRIDMLCEFITMCLPFELRFVGSFMEELGKHSYQELRQPAFTANDVDKLEKDATLKSLTLYDQEGRHRILLNVALLKSRNYNAANWHSKNFLRTDYIEDLVIKEKANETIQNELLTLYTMASRHPAFSFEQKVFFQRVLGHLFELRESRLSSIRLQQCRYPPGFDAPINPYRKVQENGPFPISYPMYHPPGLPPPPQLDFTGQFRSGWPPALTCGAPEIPPFPQPLPLQPPQPSTSPLVSSPNQSRSGSPRPPIKPPPLAFPSSVPVVPLMPVVPIEPLTRSSQSEDTISTMKADDSPICSSKPWLEGGGKQINGLRVGPAYAQAVAAPPTCNVRKSLVDQMQAIAIVDESNNSQYHSSSSSSPLQTPPDTPSSLIPVVSASNCIVTSHRSLPLENNRTTSGMPPYMPPFPGPNESRTSPPPPPQNAFTYPTQFAPIPRFFANANFRPPSTAVFGQFAPQQQPPGGGTDSGAVVTPPYQYPVPYLSFMYSSFPPLPPPASAAPHPGAAVRTPPLPGCFNCGAPGHLGQDCTQHNIDDIIVQKNVYSVEFSSDNSDIEK